MPPIAGFTYSPVNPTPLDTVVFTDISTDEDGSVVDWYWEFGDGVTSAEQNPTHQYADDGTYYVNLTVTDNDGETNTAQIILVVVPPVINIDTMGMSIHFNVIKILWPLGNATI